MQSDPDQTLDILDGGQPCAVRPAASPLVRQSAALAAASARAAGADAPKLDSSMETEHFVIHWNSAQTPQKTIALARKRAEDAHFKLAEFLGQEKVPQGKATLLIEGQARRADGSYRIPHVDGLGRIHLYRYTDSDESYFTALLHEAVHVFRRQIRNTPTWDPFLEEAFASYVSDQVAPVNPGFPLYGYPLAVVAAQWFSRGEEIPLKTLMQRHRQLNLPCKAQAYTLRVSFFRYLHQAYGKASVMQLAYGGKAHSLALYGEIFPKSFAALETEWKADLLQRFASLENAQKLADSYRSKTPVAYWRICRSGEDF